MAWVTLLLLLGLIVSTVMEDGCPYKECLCVGGEILCNYRSLTSMPVRLSDKTWSTNLNLEGNKIPTIPAGHLPANITTLSLDDNPIETINDTAFDECIYTLQELTFSQARFTQIPDAVFHLKALRKLGLYQTNILKWDDLAMTQLGAGLATFDLDTVGLTTWPTWIKSMVNLTKLSISGSSISSIPDDDLDLMAGSLIDLSLDNNSLIALPKSLVKMTVLSRLSVDHNKVTDVTYLPQLTHLSTLSLNNNKITDAQSLSSALKPYASTLSSFDIHNNLLTSIPELSFLTLITTLDLTFNLISDSNSGSAPSAITDLNFGNNFLSSIPRILKGLNLEHKLELQSNNIRFFQGSDFPSGTTEVDFSSNLISQLTRSSFQVNSSITILTLSNNPITSVSLDAFSNLPVLNKLVLQNTKLTRLPLAISSLNQLTFLDVSENANLICTCTEQSLQVMIQTLDIYSIIGDCGLSSVYYFFRKLSPGCPPITD